MAMSNTTHLKPERVAQRHPEEPTSSITVRTARRTATLERNSLRLINSASRAGVDITYLGIAPLFDEPRAYAGQQTDWIIRPAADHDESIVPASEGEKLQRLIHAGIDFPLVYVAHEIPKGRLAMPEGTTGAMKPQPVELDHATAAEAVGPVPVPAATSALAERLGHKSEHLLAVLRTALPIAGAIAAAPFILAGAAVAALANGLDPIVFGAIPAGPPSSGQPAAWYILARWEWQGTPLTSQWWGASSPL
jgi:hypothetical protein